MALEAQWRRVVGPFQLVIAASVVFFVLTVAAMLLYPGGRVGDPQSRGYAFFSNFFSDLGQTRTYGGHANVPSLVLFCIALVATAIAVSLFFVAFCALFAPSTNSRRISTAGAFCGVVAGICFAGVAATPWDLYLAAHNDFVQWAFRSFLLAVILCGIASAMAPGFPRRFLYVFSAFAILLAAYVALLTAGPSAATPQGAAIQATAQKIIVYASIFTVLVQAVNAQRLIASGSRLR